MITQNIKAMETVVSLLCVLFVYSISLVQGPRYEDKMQQVPDPLAKTEVKKEQRFERGDLKGPRAKNHPTHQYRTSKVVVAAPSEASEKPTGPAAKNYRPWQDDTRAQHVVVTKKKRKNLKGPRAKNHKPWNN